MILSFDLLYNPGQMNNFDSNTSKQHLLTKLFICSETYGDASPPAAWKHAKTGGREQQQDGEANPWENYQGSSHRFKLSITRAYEAAIV